MEGVHWRVGRLMKFSTSQAIQRHGNEVLAGSHWLQAVRNTLLADEIGTASAQIPYKL